MQELKIRNISDEIVTALDEIVMKEKYTSRNQLLVEILTQYTSNRSRFFLTALPPTVKFIVEDCLIEQTETAEKMMKVSHELNVQILKKLDELCSIFENES